MITKTMLCTAYFYGSPWLWQRARPYLRKLANASARPHEGTCEQSVHPTSIIATFQLKVIYCIMLSNCSRAYILTLAKVATCKGMLACRHLFRIALAALQLSQVFWIWYRMPTGMSFFCPRGYLLSREKFLVLTSGRESGTLFFRWFPIPIIWVPIYKPSTLRVCIGYSPIMITTIKIHCVPQYLSEPIREIDPCWSFPHWCDMIPISQYISTIILRHKPMLHADSGNNVHVP